MAKKKRQTPKKGPKQSPGKKAPKRAGPTEIGLPDSKTLQGFMEALLGGLVGPSPDTAEGRAQEVMARAFEEPDPDRRSELAREALAVSPDCADAYVLLAEHARSRKEAAGLFEQAVAAGERVLGPGYFEENAGHFWGLFETRPYMRAREGLAHVLWTMGRREEAAGHLREMLRLNPGDNQGVRYTLASWLLSLDRDDDLARLLAEYDEDSATWAYTRVLLAFRSQGDSAEARALLKVAKKANKHVPAFLAGEEQPPVEPPPYYSPGDPSEAMIYVANGLSAWRSTPGAITWLRGATKSPRPKKKKAPKEPPAQGPIPLVKERLRRLPQEFDVWQAGLRHFPKWIEEGGERMRPWMAMVTSRTGDLVLGNALSIEPPTPEWLWDALAASMLKPAMGDPHRPTTVQVRAEEGWDALLPHLEEIGVTSEVVDALDQWDFAYNGLAEHLAREEPPGLLEMPGVSPGLVAGFYRAAAEFYRRAPWKALGFEEAIKIECGRFDSGPWYAVVMGQSGLTLGVALYEDLDLLRRMWAGELSDEENARQTVALSVTFDPADQLHPAELDAAHEHGWEVAGPEAYPSVFRKERGMSIRPPLAWELELLEACLRAIPEFVADHRQDDTSRHRATVPAAAGKLDLTLSWIGGE